MRFWGSNTREGRDGGVGEGRGGSDPGGREEVKKKKRMMGVAIYRLTGICFSTIIGRRNPREHLGAAI
jgi:hypothetical protein